MQPACRGSANKSPWPANTTGIEGWQSRKPSRSLSVRTASSRPRHGRKRAVATYVLACHGSAAVYPWSWTTGHFDEDRASSPVALVVEVRAALPDLPQLPEVGGELARHVVPADFAGGIQNSGGLVVRVVRAKIREQPGAQTFRLSDVQHSPRCIEHLVHRRPVLGEGPHPPAQLVQISGWKRNHPLGPRSRHRWHRWQNTVVRPSIVCVPASRVPQTRHCSPSRPYTCSSS